MSKFINLGQEIQITNAQNIAITDQLEPGFYKINFSPMSGYSLSVTSELEQNEKMYGHRQELTKHMVKAYEKMNRSMGVLLSGPKGIGKTMFSKHFIEQLIHQHQRPVVLVTENTPGLADFLDQLSKDTVVLFDEFEKNFKSTDDQESLLSLFDGTSNTKRLYILTINELYHLSDYFINRPGRIHYHICFEYPNKEEIKEFLTDNVKAKYQAEIQEVDKFANLSNLTYDALRSIAFELNLGFSFKEALNVLNIQIDTEEMSYWATFYDRNNQPIDQPVELDNDFVLDSPNLQYLTLAHNQDSIQFSLNPEKTKLKNGIIEARLDQECLNNLKYHKDSNDPDYKVLPESDRVTITLRRGKLNHNWNNIL